MLDGYDACLAALVAQDARAADAQVLACSCAGGGLRIAVVGNEELVTAEAGRRVALSQRRQGGRGRRAPRVVRPRRALTDGSRDDRPDVVLLIGGTDGGNAEVLLDAARTWSRPAGAGPVVVAGNVDARDEVAADPRRRRRAARRSPTTWCRGSASWRPIGAGPRSARCSWPT